MWDVVYWGFVVSAVLLFAVLPGAVAVWGLLCAVRGLIEWSNERPPVRFCGGLRWHEVVAYLTVGWVSAAVVRHFTGWGWLG